MLPKIGVLLANLGTPDNYDFFSIRSYLSEFLKDKRIIELNKLLWYPILYGTILNTRPFTTGANYKNIWNNESKNSGSPLLYYTELQAAKLNTILNEKYKCKFNIKVEIAMRYGKPSINQAINELQNCEKIIILPLFPQYSATTTASIFDVIFTKLTKLRNIPAITTVKTFAADPNYIEALANSITKHLQNLDFKPQKILASFHGIPLSYCQKGDPYYEECLRSINALKELMQDNRLELCFQSRFGKAKWLRPYITDLVKDLAKNNITKIAVFNPGFLSDCLETIDEIGRELKEYFFENGGTNFSRIPCLNATNHAIKILENICSKELNNF